jgi:hypothetical protein
MIADNVDPTEKSSRKLIEATNCIGAENFLFRTCIFEALPNKFTSFMKIKRSNCIINGDPLMQRPVSIFQQHIVKFILTDKQNVE